MSQLIRLTAAEEENGPEGRNMDTQISQTAVLPVSVSTFKNRNDCLCLQLKPMSIPKKKKTFLFLSLSFVSSSRLKKKQKKTLLSTWITSLTVGLVFPSVHKVWVDRQVVWHLWAPPGVCVLTPTEPPCCLMVYDEHAGGACVHSCAFITCTHPPWDPPPRWAAALSSLACDDAFSSLFTGRGPGPSSDRPPLSQGRTQGPSTCPPLHYCRVVFFYIYIIEDNWRSPKNSWVTHLVCQTTKLEPLDFSVYFVPFSAELLAKMWWFHSQTDQLLVLHLLLSSLAPSGFN